MMVFLFFVSLPRSLCAVAVKTAAWAPRSSSSSSSIVAARRSGVVFNTRRRCSVVARAAAAGDATRSRSGDAFPTAFELQLPQGFCVGVRMTTTTALAATVEESTTTLVRPPPDMAQVLERELHPSEIDFPLGKPQYSAVEFWGGRLAMRRALGSSDVPPILRRLDGAPLLPEKYAGSISHKGNLAVAIVAERTIGLAGIGVDLELASSDNPRLAERLAARILSEGERSKLAVNLPELPASLRPRLCFSLKEAVYKAISTESKRRVGFREVEIEPRADGSCGVHISPTVLGRPEHDEPPLRATWRRIQVQEQQEPTDYFLSVAELFARDHHLDDDAQESASSPSSSE